MTSILHVEDSPLDHKLLRAQLAQQGLTVRMSRVETEAAMRAALLSEPVDLILADYNLPQFSGMGAIEVAAEVTPGVPVIIVSGAMGEQAAVDILRAGAIDYVLKDHLERLGGAIRRALREAADRLARRQAEEEVRKARDVAEAANRAKDHFLAVLSHELRTPLTPVMTAVQMMETDSSVPDHWREQIQMIRRNVELEVKLIDDLLDLTRVSRGKLELHLQPTDLHEKVRQVLAICDADLRAKRLTVATHLEARHHRVQADSARLQQILWNVVKNAVKFTDAGGSVVIRTANVPGGRVEVSVTDSGVGIELDKVSRIFDAFEQGGKHVTRQFGGLGLGLAISRAIAEQHGGTLTAASEGAGRGATFSLTLPATVQSDVAQSSTSRVPGSSSLADCSVLLVEDHPDTARAMGRILKMWGCNVQIADTVAGALQVADAKGFDVIISDIGLPDGSGFDLIRQLLTRRPVKGIALSGFGMEEDLRLSKEAGFAEHLVKPVNLQQLEAAVKRAIASE
ncbi:MAG TPA: response regulator [Tepidisphaeraceae bacterium]|jgi:signal transduction histidine kinase|nr:response regulator [Tepidisphaeraceae bacterium]